MPIVLPLIGEREREREREGRTTKRWGWWQTLKGLNSEFYVNKALKTHPRVKSCQNRNKKRHGLQVMNWHSKSKFKCRLGTWIQTSMKFIFEWVFLFQLALHEFIPICAKELRYREFQTHPNSSPKPFTPSINRANPM